MRMINRIGNTIYVKGAITVNNVVANTRRGIIFFDGSDLIIDLADVVDVDSTIASMMLEWLREANRQRHQIHFINLPKNLYSLVQLYGVSELILSDHNPLMLPS